MASSYILQLLIMCSICEFLKSHYFSLSNEPSTERYVTGINITSSQEVRLVGCCVYVLQY